MSPGSARAVLGAGASCGIGRATAARRDRVVFGTSRGPRRVDAAGVRPEVYRSSGTPVIGRFRRSLSGPEPDPFAAVVVRAIEARSPRGTDRVGRLATSLPALLPDPVFRAVFARFFGPTPARRSACAPLPR